MLYNCHTHTRFSHDSSARLQDICDAAIAAKLSGVLISDHCDCEYAERTDYFRLFSDCREAFLRVRDAYRDRLPFFFGIELGDPHFAPEFAERITKAFPFDAVLLSVHAVQMPGFDAPFSTIHFDDKDSSFIRAYLKQYFDDLLESVQRFDFDILAHLTVPLRYIMLNYRKPADIEPFLPVIEQILRTVISRDKALEINTSALTYPNGFLMPDETIIHLYTSLGGQYFTLGSDAHDPGDISLGFKTAITILRKQQHAVLCYYRNRQRTEYEF